jgi:hypothetical protein
LRRAGKQRRAYVLRFRIELLGIDPPIWRRVLVPEDCTFWDLHVAIQDAMGWTDSHLHLFRVVGSEAVIGMPDEEGDGPFDTQPGWVLRVQDFVFPHSPLATYQYDFGDSWIHEVRLEGVEPAEAGATYPRCIAGARRCPPEDVGGTHGYEEFLEVIADRSHPEHEHFLQWAGGAFDAEEFDPAAVRFQDPTERWREVFEELEG